MQSTRNYRSFEAVAVLCCTIFISWS